ncbi:MAG: AhpC/TSA family protein [Prevotella sp.]|jgi:thiol-disulfide isomerase/thioredoxin|nr:AhpC/TSA family protein [Prevotella sp.]
MKVKSILILTAAGIMLAACQSNTYHIKGTVKDVQEDTLFLTTDLQQGTPRDTILVKDGQFELSGETDSTYFCMIYSKNEEALNIPLFIEPGTTKVLLSKTPGEGRVGGTPINDEFQRMTDSTMVIGKEINNIAEKVFANEKATQEEQQQAWAQIEKLNQRHAKVVLDFTERNIKNELGYFLLTMYPEEVIPNTDRLRLIKMMPAELRQRDAIKTIEQQIGNASKTEEGAVIEDFTMPSIEGVPMSIMSEVGKNKITVLDFWASWCGPCRQETPLMVEIYKKYKDKGLGFVGISLDEDGDAWKQATDQLGIVWPQMSDLKGWENAAAQMFNITSIPHTIVVDQQGKILRRGLRGEQLEQFIAGQLQ